jgi:hypothetical protein
MRKKVKRVTALKMRSYERKQPLAITPVEYGGPQEAYDHFNKELFEGALPDAFITYQRKAHSLAISRPSGSPVVPANSPSTN